MADQERSKEALAMIALHEALRNVCLNYDWTYSVFWTIRPRPRCRGGSNCKMIGEDNGSLMLMWEDGFCNMDQRSVIPNSSNISGLPISPFDQTHENSYNNLSSSFGHQLGGQDHRDHDTEDPIWKFFRKMSIQLYNYGEGLMGKVASDKCHKWVFKESPECEVGISSYWQSSFDAHPPEWMDQFAAGIQTIAVIQAGQGLLQLGSCKVVPEDLHFVLRMRHTFESLEYPCRMYLPQPFATGLMRNGANMINQGLMNYPTNFPPPPPSPHSWSLSTLPTSLQDQATRFRAIGNEAALKIDVSRPMKEGHLDQSPRLSLNSGGSPLKDHHHSNPASARASPCRQNNTNNIWVDQILPPSASSSHTNTPTSKINREFDHQPSTSNNHLMMPTLTDHQMQQGGAGNITVVNTSNNMEDVSQSLMHVAASPSFSKLYQRRHSNNTIEEHQSNSPFLAISGMNSPVHEIALSSLEALLKANNNNSNNNGNNRSNLSSPRDIRKAMQSPSFMDHYHDQRANLHSGVDQRVNNMHVGGDQRVSMHVGGDQRINLHADQRLNLHGGGGGGSLQTSPTSFNHHQHHPMQMQYSSCVDKAIMNNSTVGMAHNHNHNHHNHNRQICPVNGSIPLTSRPEGDLYSEMMGAFPSEA